MTVKERLIKFAKSQERSVRAFESNAGLGYGYVNAIRVSIQPDKIKSIASHYPELNIDWLLTGNGNMINDSGNELEKVAGIVADDEVSEVNHGNTPYGSKPSQSVTIPREVFEMMNKLADTVQSHQ